MYPIAAASLYTTTEDYARFLSALLARENVLSPTLSNPTSVDRALNLDWRHGPSSSASAASITHGAQGI
jgi:CubicO group peptidase (beta-lactamase class C family)